MNNKKISIPVVLALAGALLMLLTIFLPYIAVTDKVEDTVEVYQELFDVDMDEGDYKSISMTKIPGLLNESEDGVGTIYSVIVILVAGFSALAALCAFFKKPILAIICGIISAVVFTVQNTIYTASEIVPSDYLKWGIAYYVFYIAAIVLLVGAIAIIVSKRAAKKQ